MSLVTPGLPSRSNRLRIEWPIWFNELTSNGSRFGLTGLANGGIQMRPGNGPLWCWL